MKKITVNSRVRCIDIKTFRIYKFTKDFEIRPNPCVEYSKKYIPRLGEQYDTLTNYINIGVLR